MDGTVAIALPADTESARTALLHGRRVAHEFGLSWFAVFIEPQRGTSRGTVPALAALVAAQGGSLQHAQGKDVASAVVEISRNARAHVLVIGPSRRPRILRRLIRGTTEHILQARRPFAVIVAGKRMAS